MRLTKEQLESLYWINRKTLAQIAQICGVSIPAIRQRMKRMGIPRRTNSEAQCLSNGTQALTKERLTELYHGKELSQSQIGKLFSVSQSAIRGKMKYFGIKARNTANKGPSNGMYGRTHTPEARARIRAANRRQFADSDARARHAILTCQQIAEGRTGRRTSKLEDAVAAQFDIDGITYVRQHRVGRFSYDFYLPNSNTLIEAHGTFWHADPRFYSHDNLSPIQKRNIENDKAKALKAQGEGYTLQVIWEHDILPR